MQSRYIVKVSAANMPNSCWGRYVRVGVVELEPGFEGEPTQLSSRAKGVRRVVETWERQHMGSTDRCSAARAIAAAEELAARLNDEALAGLR